MDKKETKVLIIIPAYNEEENIAAVIEHLNSKILAGVFAEFSAVDYLIINDGSRDATLEICGAQNFCYLNLPINLGIGGAVQAGYMFAKRNGYDIAVQMDGDGQHDISYLNDMIAPLLEDKADIVIGSRFLEKEGFQSSGIRRMGIKFLSFLIRLTTNRKIMDVTSGYRAVNKRFINIYVDDYPTDYPEPEAIVTAIMNKGRIMEVPVQMHAREGGSSSITFGKSVYYMIKVTLAILVCRLSYGIRR